MNEKDKIMKQIKKINGTMSQENLPLNKELIIKLYRCLKTNTTKEELDKVLKKHRRG
jgi:hypothetical protein